MGECETSGLRSNDLQRRYAPFCMQILPRKVSVRWVEGLFLVERVHSVNTYVFQLSHKGVSKVSERARERSKRAKWAKRCGASERIERGERTNKRSERPSGLLET